MKQRLPKELDPNYVPGKRSGSVAAIFSVGLVLLIVLGFVYRQRIVDQITVWNFTPTSEVAALAERSMLSDEGKFYLYASRTELGDRAAFNKACGSLQNEKTVVIGCYTTPDRRIYVFDVADSQLDGVKETSAAHEMLHAAYDRLSSGERKRVDELLVKQRETVTDERLKKIIAYYEEAEPNDVINELHSIFGTELKSLSPELERYYKRYFTDRSVVVALKEKYEKVFTDLAETQTRLVRELNQLANDINTRQETYQRQITLLNSDIAAFNAWAESGVATRSEFYSRRATLESRVQTLDQERAYINAQIDTYNTKKAELDKLNLLAVALNQSIDSKQLPDAPKL